MAKSKRTVDGIDEEAMLRSIFERDNHVAIPPQQREPEPEKSEPPKADNHPKRAKLEHYESMFIHEPNLPPARYGKSVYIRKEHHNRIARIVTVIGDKEVSLFGYIDNVLTHHFAQFDDDIDLSIKKKLIHK
ncbi:MAG: DUF3408 domain-containing protein [Alistipes sp.]|jgi:hypothetical protein|nr:DUF3408 domain-containing protein [Alistipes sp.]